MNIEINENVLITGVSGLIGSRLARSLAQAGYNVIGFDLKQPKSPIAEEGFNWYSCDLTNHNDVQNKLALVANKHGRHFASVIHLAAYYDFSGADSPLYDELTVGGTETLIRKLYMLDVEQFVFSSTILVMDQAREPGIKITESSPIKPEWLYPKSKLRTEKLLEDQHKHIPVVILRIAGVYDDYCHSPPIAHQIERIYEKQLESYFFPGNPEHGQPFIHLDDLTACFKQVINFRPNLGTFETFLIGEEDIVAYSDLQELIGTTLHGKNWPTIKIPKTAAKVGAWVKDKITPEKEFIQPWMIDLADAHYPIDISKAKALLNWQPEHSLRTHLPIILHNFLNDPEWWYEQNHLRFEGKEIPGASVEKRAEASNLSA
ncbi:MAG: NAD-dependent epimerase/dehydratase family protein [Oligoflexales bacterium]